MKKLYLLLFTLFTLTLYSQENIRVGLFQDGSLLVSDDTHGNTSPTIDMMLSFDLQGKQFSSYYFSMRTQMEFADLYSGKFYRYSVIPMWNFNGLDVDGVEVGIGGGIGMIHKNGGASMSYSIVAELSYPFAEDWRVGLRNEWVHRSELETKPLRYNLSFGVTFEFGTH